MKEGAMDSLAANTENPSTDARLWAQAFVDAVQFNPAIATDINCMTSWFANAIMAGYQVGCASSSNHKTICHSQSLPVIAVSHTGADSTPANGYLDIQAGSF